MDVELCTDLLTKCWLDRLDPGHTGAFIEIGLGGIDFSFTWAAPAGFACVAVEPLPTPALVTAARQHDVPLLVAAVSAVSGEVPIYLGNLNGSTLTDISSLHARWWGAGRETRMVRSLTLPELIQSRSIASISFLKIDTEGSERSIVEGLRALEVTQLPKMIAIEFGGGGTRASKQGGWSDEFLDATIASLRTLRSVGYPGGLLIEKADAKPRRVDFAALDSWESLFPDDACGGNFIALRELPSAEQHEADADAIAPTLARAERRAVFRHRIAWFKHHQVRLVAGIRRRLGSTSSNGA